MNREWGRRMTVNTSQQLCPSGQLETFRLIDRHHSLSSCKHIHQKQTGGHSLFCGHSLDHHLPHLTPSWPLSLTNKRAEGSMLLEQVTTDA